jgi:hypothetical protein
VLFSAALSPSHQRNAGTLDIELQPLLYRRRIYIPLAPLRRQCGIRVAEFKNRKFVSLDSSCFCSLKRYSPSNGPDCLTFTLHRSHSCMSLCPIHETGHVIKRRCIRFRRYETWEAMCVRTSAARDSVRSVEDRGVPAIGSLAAPGHICKLYTYNKKLMYFMSVQ